VLKMGRTQLQDAVPMTLGQEFHGYATTLREEIRTLRRTSLLLLEVNLGATAIGTGLNTPGYAQVAAHRLAEVTGLPIVSSEDLVEATSDNGAYVLMHAAAKRAAVKLSKICNDLRLLSSGPEPDSTRSISPSCRPGSSIMPAKVNPVIPEVVNQVCFKVIGNDTTITMAAEAGQLQLNVMEPSSSIVTVIEQPAMSSEVT
jgi:aspartate ammonia-lyase